MRFSWLELTNVLSDVNDVLSKLGSTEKIEMTSSLNFINLYSKNLSTNNEKSLIEDLNRDQAYYWLEGLITALIN